jgi:hypothetical protein
MRWHLGGEEIDFAALWKNIRKHPVRALLVFAFSVWFFRALFSGDWIGS